MTASEALFLFYPASGLSFILVDEQELIGEWIFFVLFYLGGLWA